LTRTRRSPCGGSGYTRTRKNSPCVCSNSPGSTPRRSMDSNTWRARSFSTGTASRMRPSMSSANPTTLWPGCSGNSSRPSSTRELGLWKVMSMVVCAMPAATSIAIAADASRTGTSASSACMSMGWMRRSGSCAGAGPTMHRPQSRSTNSANIERSRIEFPSPSPRCRLAALPGWRLPQQYPDQAGATSLRRLGRPEVAAAVHAGAVEAAGAALARSKHVAGGGDPLHPGLGLLAGGHPLDPVAPRDRGDVVPGGLRGGMGRQRLAQVGRHLRLRLLRQRRNFQGHFVAGLYCRGLEQRLFHLQPVTALPIRLQRGLERRAGKRTPTATWLRVGNLALAALGRTKKAQLARFGCAGLCRVAWKRTAAGAVLTM